MTTIEFLSLVAMLFAIIIASFGIAFGIMYELSFKGEQRPPISQAAMDVMDDTYNNEFPEVNKQST